MATRIPRLEQQHSDRFRQVATRYPLRVAEAYDGDVARAAQDSDEQVAATVREWEIRQGIGPMDWRRIGRCE